MKVSIVYGWSEGHWQGKFLRHELRNAGFHITNKVQEADVIIAHSGGCYMLPKKSKANLVLLVGLPYYPGKHPLKSLRQKIRTETKNGWWFRKTFFNSFYFITRPRRWYKMWKAWKRRDLPDWADTTVVAVRNEHDHFTHPTGILELATQNKWSLQSQSGHHDDLWINPKPYVKIVQEALAETKPSF